MTKQAKICFLLLCHKDPPAIIEQIDYLVSSGGYVIVHIDKNTPESAHAEVYAAFAGNENVRFAEPVRAGWGDWSLVKATLRMIDTALIEFPAATHFYYLSGDCVPIRSHEELQSEFSKMQKDYIETADFYKDGWISTGPHLERIDFYHFINERKYKSAFYALYRIQRLLKIKRKVPEGLNLRIGSQWWCLRRRTLQRIQVYLLTRADVVRFFKWTWIPDEIFFQSMVATLVAPQEIKAKPPTFLRFSDYGLPTVFYNDHYEFLTHQEEFFARKISPSAKELKKRLIAKFKAPSDHQEHTDLGRNTVGFNVYAGRHGVRFGPRFWQKGERLPLDSRLYVIISKKWHVGKEFLDKLTEITGIPNFGYLFDEIGEEIVDMGGFEKERFKRNDVPAAYLRMLYETHKLNEAIIGVDSVRHVELGEISKYCADMRGIEIENYFSAEYLDGHAERAGLMVQKSDSFQRSTLHRTITEIFRDESAKIRTIPFTKLGHIREWHSSQTRAEILANTFDGEADDFIKMVDEVNIRD